MKHCLINQPGGLGDIMFCQPIVDKYIKLGYTVQYPVLSEYYDQLCKYIKKDNLIWHDVSKGNFPLSQYYGKGIEFSDDNNIYVPLEYSDNYIISNSPNIAKYFYTDTPLSDWRKSLHVDRDLNRETELIDRYGLHGDYVIINKEFTGLPYTRSINIDTGMKTHTMSWQQDKDNGFTLFDWISALQNAKEIHSVGTSLCYLVDKYCTENKIFIYERRLDNQQRNYHRDHYIVYRNPNWIYTD